MNRANNIHRRVSFSFALVLLASISLFTLVFLSYFRKTETENVTDRLNVAINVAWDLFTSDSAKLESTLNQTILHVPLAEHIIENDTQWLDRALLALQNNNEFFDYIAITNTDGMILTSTNDPKGSRWFLADMLPELRQKKHAIQSFEMMPEEFLLAGDQALRQMARVTYTAPGSNGASVHKTVDKALFNIVLAPVVDDNNIFVGSVAAGVLLNNNEVIPRTYTDKVPKTYLSIGVDGVRISSNILINNFYYPRGSLQEPNLVHVTERGERFSGNVTHPSGLALIVVDPIKNHRGEVIGNMGVGAPISVIPEFQITGLLFIGLAGVLIFSFSLLLVDLITKFITRPIYKLQTLAKEIISNGVQQNQFVWKEKNAPIELQDLAENMLQMAENLTTQNMLLEEKVNERTERLEKSISELKNASEYKSQFLANMSHELRTPLNSIIGYTGILKDKLFGELNEKQEKYLGVILDSGNQLLELINDILDMIKYDQRIEQLHVAPMNLNEAITDFTELLHPQIRAKEITLTVNLEENLPEPNWDAKKIRQIFQNLLTNAIKFTSAQGTIDINVSRNGNKLKISFADNGIGISPAMREKVFLPFEQVDTSTTKSYRGVGLGLAICKSLVELHKGSIWVEGNPGGGTLVCCLIPIDPMVEEANHNAKENPNTRR